MRAMSRDCQDNVRRVHARAAADVRGRSRSSIPAIASSRTAIGPQLNRPRPAAPLEEASDTRFHSRKRAIENYLCSVTLPPASMDNCCQMCHLQQDRSSAPKGQPYVSPGQKQCESCEHCCRPGLTWSLRLSPSERATQMPVFLVSPLQGFLFVFSCTQGGAPRLRRCALPWANIWLPLRPFGAKVSPVRTRSAVAGCIES